MFDSVTLDQLRTLLAVVDEGSFSAAARRLKRVQSAVSHAMANLESQLGVAIWDRSTKIATLTDHGRAVLAAARRVCAEADALGRAVDGLVGGLEPSVSLCMDQIFPLGALVDLCREFARAFTAVELCVHTETLSAVTARVMDKTCHLGVVGPAARMYGLTQHHIASVRMVPVVAPTHPLAAAPQRISIDRMAEHTQIVLSERGEGGGPDQAVLSSTTWRIADLHTKHEMLRAGLGWGNMPEHMVQEDLAARRLLRIWPEAWDDDGILLPLAMIHLPGIVMGPATRWLMMRMKELCLRDLSGGPLAHEEASLPIPPPGRRGRAARSD